MDTSNLDIIYFIKDSAFNEELRYSLRSVEQNFPHNRVVFYGGKPCGLIPDLHYPMRQMGKTKWDKVRDMLVLVCKNDALSEDIVLFNDDFFVMSPIKCCVACVEESLSDLIVRIEVKNGYRSTGYTRQLLKTYSALKSAGLSTLNFELHRPMAINRKKMLKVRERFPGVPASRSLYGNSYCTNFSRETDNKIVELDKLPGHEDIYISTDDKSFADGKIGQYIRNAFPNKSKFER